jgi:hypothetical protein
MMDCGVRPEEAMRMRKEHVFWDRSVGPGALREELQVKTLRAAQRPHSQTAAPARVR